MRRLIPIAVVLAFCVAELPSQRLEAPKVTIRHAGGPLARLLLAAPRVASVSAVTFVSFEQVAIDATAGGKSFTATKLRPNGSGTFPQATIAQCRQELAEVRFTVDGTTVTSAVGTLLEIGDWLTLSGADILQAWRSIRTGGVSGQADCTYYQL